MRTLLSTVLRGLRSRALLSGGSILLVALAVASAVLGPQFAQSVTSSFLVARLGQAPQQYTALTWTYTPKVTEADPTSVAADAMVAADGAFTPPSGEGRFLPADHGILLTQAYTALTTDWRLLAIGAGDGVDEGVCGHLVVTGRCPTAPGEVLMLASDAVKTLAEPGTTFDLDDLGVVTVVGTYTAPGPDEDDFWITASRFGSRPPVASPQPGPANFRPAPLVTVSSSFATIDRSLTTVLVDRRLDDSPDLTVDDLPGLAAATKLQQGPPIDTEQGTLTPDPINSLASIADEVVAQQDTARSSIAPAVISVVLVALALLLRLLTAAADLRLPELALASLRGTPRRRMWQLGLSEPLALLLLAVPTGLVLGIGSSWLLARAWLVPGLPLPITLTGVLAGVGVALAAVGVAVVAVGLVLRLPLTDQLTGVRRPRPTGRLALVVQLALVAAAVAVLVSKLSASGPGDPDVTDLVLPVLLAVVAGLAATRLSVLVARWATRRRGRSLPRYVASRAISRRQEGSLVILPVTAAIAICVFGAGVYGSAAAWRSSVAATAAPAPVLWRSPLPLAGAVDLTHRLDPDGRWLMAAGTLSSQGPTYTVLDTPRLARVGLWQDQWTPGTSPAEISRLLAPTATQPVITGTRVGLTVDRDTDQGEDLYIRLRVTGQAGEPTFAFLGPYPVGTSTVEVSGLDCQAGCTLEGITLGRSAALPLAVTGTVTMSDLTADGEPVPGALGDSAGWTIARGATGRDAITDVSSSGGELRVGLDSATPVIAQLTSGDVPEALPVVAGVDAQVTTEASQVFRSSALTADLDPVLTARSVPLLGPVGVLIDYAMFSTGRTLYDQRTPVYVLARSDTPGAITQELRDAGLSESTTYAAEKRVLDGSAYALALRLYAVVAGLVLLMALAGLFVSTAVQLPARRRDAAALRVVGVPRRTVGSAVLRELGLVLGSTAVAGLVAGSVAQYVVLRTVTLGYAEDIRTPALVAALDPVRLVLLAVVGLVLLGAVAAVSALLTVRGARGATLRENAR